MKTARVRTDVPLSELPAAALAALQAAEREWCAQPRDVKEFNAAVRRFDKLWGGGLAVIVEAKHG